MAIPVRMAAGPHPSPSDSHATEPTDKASEPSDVPRVTAVAMPAAIPVSVPRTRLSEDLRSSPRLPPTTIAAPSALYSSCSGDLPRWKLASA
jgi:hypothetical protein